MLKTLDWQDLVGMQRAGLQSLCRDLGITGHWEMTRSQMQDKIAAKLQLKKGRA